METDSTAGIETDHIPILADVNCKLKKMQMPRKSNPSKLENATEFERMHYNDELNDVIEPNTHHKQAVQMMKRKADELIGKTEQTVKKQPISKATNELMDDTERGVA